MNPKKPRKPEYLSESVQADEARVQFQAQQEVQGFVSWYVPALIAVIAAASIIKRRTEARMEGSKSDKRLASEVARREAAQSAAASSARRSL